MQIDQSKLDPYKKFFVPKGWGYELWLVNTDQYCGKILHFVAGKKCSWHYHLMKDEVFYVNKGRVLISFSYENDINKAVTMVLEEGATFHVNRGMKHQIEAILNSEIIEFSTRHEESDSYRIIKGD